MILDQFRIDGQVAVVTGGTKGLGKAIVLALAEAGADIVAVSRNPNLELETAVNQMGRDYSHIRADLTQRNQTRKVIA